MHRPTWFARSCHRCPWTPTAVSLVPLLRVIGAAHAVGATVDTPLLFAGRAPAARNAPEGTASWVAPFAVEYLRTAVPPQLAYTPEPSTWSVFAPSGHPLGGPRCAASTAAGIGDGVLLCLPDSGEDRIPLTLDAGRAAAARPGLPFVVVQNRLGAAARTQHPAGATTVVGVTVSSPLGDTDVCVGISPHDRRHVGADHGSRRTRRVGPVVSRRHRRRHPGDDHR
jgi:hypothetical protein